MSAPHLKGCWSGGGAKVESTKSFPLLLWTLSASSTASFELEDACEPNVSNLTMLNVPGFTGRVDRGFQPAQTAFGVVSVQIDQRLVWSQLC